jgi:hypothetical protein
VGDTAVARLIDAARTGASRCAYCTAESAVSTHRVATATRPWQRRMLMAVGAGAAAVCLLVSVALIALHTPPVRRLVANRIIDVLERQHVAVSAQEFRYNLLDASVSLQQVQIRSTAWRDGPPLVTIGRAHVVVNLPQLLRGATSWSREHWTMSTFTISSMSRVAAIFRTHRHQPTHPHRHSAHRPTT